MKNNTFTAVGARNIFLLIFGKGISLVGGRMFDFAIAFTILKLTGSGMACATSCLLIYLPHVLISPLAGFLADKYNRKTLIILADLTAAAVLGLLYGLVAGMGVHLSFLFTAIFLLSLVETVFSISFDALIPLIAEPERLKKVYSLNQTISSLANILSPLLGGVIIQFFSLETFILVNAVSFIFSAVSEQSLVVKTLPPTGGGTGQPASGPAKRFNALAYIRRHPVLFRVLVLELVLNSLIHLAFSVPFPYLLVNIYDFDARVFGLIRACPSIGALGVAFYYSLRKDHFGKPHFPRTTILLFAFYFFGLALFCTKTAAGLDFSIQIILLALHSLCFGILIVVIDIPLKLLRQFHTAEASRGKVLAVSKLMTNISIPLMYVLSGIIIERWHLAVLPLFAAGSLVFYLLVSSPHLRKK